MYDGIFSGRVFVFVLQTDVDNSILFLLLTCRATDCTGQFTHRVATIQTRTPNICLYGLFTVLSANHYTKWPLGIVVKDEQQSKDYINDIFVCLVIIV